MQIFTNGQGKKDFAPDQIIAIVTFGFRADTYDEALKGGVEKVRSYIEDIAEVTDFEPSDFKTRAYAIQERFHVNSLTPKTEADLDKNLQKRVSDGFFFTQYAHLKFDYDKMRLAKLLAISSKLPNSPMLHIDFSLKDVAAKNRELIALAYNDAEEKAAALASAAGKTLKNCVRVEIDKAPQGSMRDEMMFKKEASFGAALGDSFEQQLQNIDETFQPDDITLTKEISCVWKTNR